MDKSFSETYLDFKQINPETMNQAILDTLYMTLISMVLVTIIGLVLGLILYSIGRKNKPYARIIYGIVSIISNIFRTCSTGIAVKTEPRNPRITKRSASSLCNPRLIR